MSFTVLNDDAESWEMQRLLRASIRKEIAKKRAPLLKQLRLAELQLEELRLREEQLDEEESQAWRKRTGGFGLRSVK